MTVTFVFDWDSCCCGSQFNFRTLLCTVLLPIILFSRLQSEKLVLHCCVLLAQFSQAMKVLLFFGVVLAAHCFGFPLPVEKQLTTSAKNHNLDHNDNFDLYPARRSSAYYAIYDTRGTAVPGDQGYEQVSLSNVSAEASAIV